MNIEVNRNHPATYRISEVGYLINAYEYKILTKFLISDLWKL